MNHVWWDKITNAHRFIDAIVNTALVGSSVILTLPQQIPWFDTLYTYIKEELENQDSVKSFIDLSSPKQDVGKFLLNQFCTEEQRIQYRPSQSCAVFLGQCRSTVLNDHYVWVEDIPRDLWKDWIDFLTEYHANMCSNRSPAVFFLVCTEDGVQISPRRNVSCFNYRQQIHEYDYFSFCMLAASSSALGASNNKTALRSYLAELTYALCGNDIELCAACIATGRRFLEKPEETLHLIMRTQRRSDGFSFFCNTSPEAVSRKIWEAQIKTVFPCIEHFRQQFIDNYTKEIQSLLPMKGSDLEEIHEPLDVELGLLFYMVRGCLLQVSTEEYKQLEMFREARNLLAHLKPLSLPMIEKIYQITEIGTKKTAP